MAIKPLELPTSAGLAYGQGDVRHLAEGDDLSVPSVSNPTRQLAERDNLLQQKLNEAIAVINNTEQFAPLPVVRTTLPPNDETVVINYRIPAGFESRVLNASIASTPSSTDIELNVYYNTGFGGSTGTAIVTTSTEFAGGVQFYQSGEFIVSLKNKGAITLDLVASVLLTIRPLGAQGTLLVGSVISGEQGPPGVAGPPGPPGPTGSGGAGSPGMVWTGAWDITKAYNPNDVVSYTTYGTVVSSYICRAGNTGVDPTSTAIIWNPVALAGGLGAPGPTGPSGGSVVFSASEISVNGVLTAGTPFTGGVSPQNAEYTSGAVTAPGNTANVPLHESFFGLPSGTPKGITVLSGAIRTYFCGFGTLTLPKIIGGAQVDYSNSAISLTVCANGTSLTAPMSQQWRPVEYRKNSTDQYLVIVNSPNPVPILAVVNGAQVV